MKEYLHEFFQDSLGILREMISEYLPFVSIQTVGSLVNEITSINFHEYNLSKYNPGDEHILHVLLSVYVYLSATQSSKSSLFLNQIRVFCDTRMSEIGSQEQTWQLLQEKVCCCGSLDEIVDQSLDCYFALSTEKNSVAL